MVHSSSVRARMRSVSSDWVPWRVRLSVVTVVRSCAMERSKFCKDKGMGWLDGVLVRRTMKAYLHLLLAVCVLFAADVGAVQLASTFLLDLLERGADFFELALVQGVFEAAALFVLLLELLELLLLLFQFV